MRTLGPGRTKRITASILALVLCGGSGGPGAVAAFAQVAAAPAEAPAAASAAGAAAGGAAASAGSAGLSLSLGPIGSASALSWGIQPAPAAGPRSGAAPTAAVAGGFSGAVEIPAFPATPIASPVAPPAARGAVADAAARHAVATLPTRPASVSRLAPKPPRAILPTTERADTASISRRASAGVVPGAFSELRSFYRRLTPLRAAVEDEGEEGPAETHAAGDRRLDKIEVGGVSRTDELKASFRTDPYASLDEAREALGRLGLSSVFRVTAPDGTALYTASARDGVAAGQAALTLSADPAVVRLQVHPDVGRHYRLGQRASGPGALSAPEPSREEIPPAAAPDAGAQGSPDAAEIIAPPPPPAETPNAESRPKAEEIVPAATAAPASARRPLPAKVRGLAELASGDMIVRLHERPSFALLSSLRRLGLGDADVQDHKKGAAARVSFGDARGAAARAAALSKLEEVRGIDVSPAAAELLRAAEGDAGASAAPDADAASGAGTSRRPAPARDVLKAFVEFLNTRILSDGKSTLTPKQAALLLRFLKPIQAKPDAPPLPVIARNEEIKTAVPILTSPRGMRNSVVLVGPAGVGKTAVAEGLAQLIEELERGNTGGMTREQYLQARRLQGRWILDFNIDELLSMGSDEDPMAALKAVLTLVPLLNDPDPKKGNQAILVFDEIQKLFLDRSGIGLKVANYLKRPLRDGQVSVLATITEKEFKDYLEPDDAFRRRLEPIPIKEPTVEQALEMLRGLKALMEGRHDTTIPDETLVAAVKLSHRFDKENYLPDKAIKLVEDAAELTRPDNLRLFLGLEIRETWRKLSVALEEARRTLAEKALPSAAALPAALYNRIAELAADAERLYGELAAVRDGTSATSPELVKRLLAKKKDIKSGQLTLGEEDPTRYLKMEDAMGARVIHQEKAIMAVAKAIRRNKAGLSLGKRPIGKFLMPGPTGVGKTYFAKELARFLFHDPDAMIRFDMSEYMHDHEVSKFIGSPPGYVGHEEAGLLTEAVRKKPYAVILFDEIEKAHPRIWDILLQILDDGRLTDGKGRTVDFSNTVILMTSNVGMGAVDSDKFEKRLEAAATPEERAKIEAEWDEQIAAAIREGVKESFRPEFLNRLDQNPETDSKEQWITFNRLRREDARNIAELQTAEFAESLRERHDTDLAVAPEVYDFLVQRGFSAAYGARPMQKALEKFIIDPLAEWILQEEAQGRKSARGGLVRITIQEGTTHFEVLPKPPSEPPKTKLEGAAKRFAQAALEALEETLRGGLGLPDERAFHDLMTLLRRPTHSSGGGPGTNGSTGAQAAAETTARPAPFNPDTALALPEGAAEASAANGKPGSKDDNIAYETKKLLQAADERGWTADQLSVLQSASPSDGDGWLKLLVRHAKERAGTGVPEGATPAPLRLAWDVTHESIRVVIHRDGEVARQEAAYLKAHFTGAPPAGLKEARRKADLLNVPGSSLVMNHVLWNLYGKIDRLPGARIGYATGGRARGGSGTDYWLEISKKGPEAGASGPNAAAAMTPHQLREREKVQALMLKVLNSREQADNPAVQVAAATGYSMMASPRDLAAVRGWIEQSGWADKSGRPSDVRDRWPMVMTALLVFERAGEPRDIPLAEAIARKLPISEYEHLYRPIRSAAGAALTALYRRAGAEETRRALARSSEAGENATIHRAALGALGEFGAPADLEALNHNPEGLIALLGRVAPERIRQLLAEHWPAAEDAADERAAGAKWSQNSDERKRALLLLVGRGTEHPDADLEVLRLLLHERLSAERPILYAAAQAWADIIIRRGMTRGLVDQMKRYLEHHSLTHYNGTTGWPVLLAYVYALQRTGGPDALPVLEEIMKENPGSVQASHEESFFEAPITWAKVAVRNGLMPELLRPTTKEDGSRGPSRLEAMLASHNPMLGAAALYALALARDAADAAAPGSGGGSAGPVEVPGGSPAPDINSRPGGMGETRSSVSAPFHQGRLPFRQRPDLDRFDPLGPY